MEIRNSVLAHGRSGTPQSSVGSFGSLNHADVRIKRVEVTHRRMYEILEGRNVFKLHIVTIAN
jgi:hypothetical protein